MTIKRMLLATAFAGTMAMAPGALMAASTSVQNQASGAMTTNSAGSRTITVPAASDQSSGMDAAHVRSELEGLGYTNVREVERSGDVFTAIGDHKGREMRLRIDGRSGSVTDQFDRSEAAIISKPSMDTAFVKEQLELQGFENVHDVSQSGNKFSAKATHVGQPVELTVDALSGGISMAVVQR